MTKLKTIARDVNRAANNAACNFFFETFEYGVMGVLRK